MDTNNQDSGVSRDLEEAISSSLRQIPERWTDFDDDALTRIEQRALFLLVAAGLVERRISIRGEFAGQGSSIEFTIDVTGENGLAEAMEPVIAEMWTKWGPAFEEWKASEAGTATPFRFTRIGLDRWRLTEHGVLARGDLDFKASSEGSAAFVGSYQRVMEYITRTGHQADRPMVSGEGRLVEMNTTRSDTEKPEEPMPVSLTNPAELVAAFQEVLMPALVEAFNELSAAGKANPSTKKPGSGMPIKEVIAKAETHVKTHAGAYPGRNKLAKIVGCSGASIDKALKRSAYLKARRAEYEATKSGANIERQSSQPLDELACDKDWKLTEEKRRRALHQLVDEQLSDQKRERAQRKQAQRRRD